MSSDKHESEHELPSFASSVNSRRRNSSWTASARVFAAGALAMWVASHLDGTGFDAAELVPSLFSRPKHYPESTPGSPVAWFHCPDSPNTDCAFVQVPLDHLDPDSNKTVSLALRKYPASVKKSEYKGVLWVNPGGPGGTGTGEIAERGEWLSEIVEGRFDIISWDPRGVNLSAPALGCFKTQAAEWQFQRDIESVGMLYENSPASTNGANSTYSPEQLAWVRKLDGMNVALDRSCTEHGSSDILTHQSTAMAVRDLVMMNKAMGFQKLNYWGFSYGTILGGTAAAMFPELVERFVLDGVSDSIEYTNNLWNWGRSAMTDNERTLQGFFNECIKAGEQDPSRCALWQPNSTVASMYTRLNSLREHLRNHPLPTAASFGSGIVTTSMVQNSIFRGLYHPAGWPLLASDLAALEKGDGVPMFTRMNGFWLGAFHTKKWNGKVFRRPMGGSGLTCTAIECSDTDLDALADVSDETLIDYYREMGDIAISGQGWAYWIAACRRWKSRASEVYRGPWTLADGLKKPNFPILFVSNTHDPATPLAAGLRMSAGFEDSASLLIQNAYGHCSYAQPSLCTAKAIRRYFLEGAVPKNGTTCDSEPGFLFPSMKVERVSSLSVADGRLSRALEGLARKRKQVV